MQPWLRNSILVTVATIAALSVSWVGICTWVVGPQLFQAAQQGKLASEPTVCADADSRALQVLTGLLATLIGMAGNGGPPGDSR